MHILLKQFHDSRRDRAQFPCDGEAGLTLVEMLVVLVIIAVVGSMIAMNVIDRPDQAKATTTKGDIATIRSALKMYRLDNGQYPTQAQGLKALAEKPTTPPIPQTFPSEGYLPEEPTDAWGHPYVYTTDGSTFTLKSLGKDGKPGGEGLDADLDGKK